MADTKIDWADKVWNPTTGCTHVSAGCKNCYAERLAKRFWGDRKFTDVQCHEDRLKQPLHWKKPRRIFVNSVSDLFHEDVPFEFIDKVFAVMAICDNRDGVANHTFIILTKRPERMREYLTTPDRWGSVAREASKLGHLISAPPHGWPLPNVQLFVSVEDPPTANERIPLLLRTPAAVRGISYEPALEGVDFQPDAYYDWLRGERIIDGEYHKAPKIDQIIMGGESGPNHRPMDLDWALSVRDQCKAAGVAFYFKQTAGKGPIPEDLQISELI